MTAPQNCDRCPALISGRHCVVNGRGSPTAKILFVGQNPGRQEDEQGKCFVGGSGHIIASLVKMAGFDLQDLWFTNALRCLTPGNRTPKTDELRNCNSYLMEEIGEMRPDLIVALGSVALQSLMGEKLSLGSSAGRTLTNIRISKFVEDGSSISSSLIPVIPTYHPAAVMRNWSLAPLVLAHLQKATRIFSGAQQTEMGGSYMVVQAVEQLDGVVTELKKGKILSIDTETTGTNWMEDEILCLGLSNMEGVGITVPILGQGIQVLDFWQGHYPEVIDLIRELFASDVPKALQNAPFDMRFFERSSEMSFVTAATAFGWRLENLKHDTMLYHKALHEEMPKEAKPNELGFITSLYTDLAPYDEELRRQSKDKRRMDLAENAEVWGLVARDADAVSRLVPPLRAQVEAEGSDWLLDNIAIPMVRVCQDMTLQGIKVDRPYFDRLCVYYGKQIVLRKQQIAELTGFEFNPNSNVQLQDVLFKKLQLPKTGKKTLAAKECTDCQSGSCDKHDQTGLAILEELHQQTQHPALPVLIDYKKLVKMKSQYLDGSDGVSGMVPHIKGDGRIHGEFKVMGTETGRPAGANPNMLNPPKNVTIELGGVVYEDAYRQCFIAEEDEVMLEADRSQLEVWVNAYLADDKDFLDILFSGQDIHCFVARKMNDHIPDDISDADLKEQFGEERRKAKDYVFGIQFGLTVNGVMERLGCDEREAQAQLDLYFNLRPALKDYIDMLTQKVLRGEDITTPFGRVRHFPQIPILKAARQGAERWLYQQIGHVVEGLIREGINWPTQSGGSDLHSASHVWTYESCREGVLKNRAFDILNVYDSVLFQAKAPDTEFIVQTAWLVKEHWTNLGRDLIMPNGKPLGWIIPTELHWGPSWGQMPNRLAPNGDLHLDEQA